MDPLTILALGVLYFVAALAIIRSERRRRPWIILLVLLPLLYLALRWAAYRHAWLEAGLGLGLALAGLTAWWAAIGRRLPPPHDTIRVWSEDDPF